MIQINGPRVWFRPNDDDHTIYEMSGGNYLLKYRDRVWSLYRRHMGRLEFVGEFASFPEGVVAANEDFPKHF